MYESCDYMNKNQKTMVVFDLYGPYMVVGAPKCINSKGKEIDMGPVTALCRCGHSNDKPYCDGSHSKVDFSGEKDPDRREDKVVEFKGKDLTILDNRGVCSADGTCIRESPEVFQKDKKPMWIFPDNGNVRKTIETIEKCPSGALSYKIGTQRIQDLNREPAIRIAKNGPLEFVGWIELIDDQESCPESKEHYTLCRCGGSKNKPFCDNSHKKIDFKDEKN
jgi:CDGSH-type Zn-finger protein/ferredoxin